MYLRKRGQNTLSNPVSNRRGDPGSEYLPGVFSLLGAVPSNYRAPSDGNLFHHPVIAEFVPLLVTARVASSQGLYIRLC